MNSVTIAESLILRIIAAAFLLYWGLSMGIKLGEMNHPDDGSTNTSPQASALLSYEHLSAGEVRTNVEESIHIWLESHDEDKFHSVYQESDDCLFLCILPQEEEEPTTAAGP